MALAPGDPIARLAQRLGTDRYRVADRNVVPRELALGVVHHLQLDEEVDLNWTAHEILSEVFDSTGAREGTAALEESDLAAVVDAAIGLLERFPAPPAPVPLKSTLWDDAAAPLAASKLQAVNEISALTGSGPEALGPGSKERRSVFENLHRGLGFGEPPQGKSKPELARVILERVGGTWDSSCWSSGYTVTLEGLNRLLTHASIHLGVNRPRVPGPEREARILLDHLRRLLSGSDARGPFWDGRAAIGEMLAAGYRHARHTEWPGWYFEFLALAPLIEAFGGGPHHVPPVTFDYKANHLWDLKTHANSRDQVLLLNDQRGIDAAISDHGGVGFIVLHGDAIYDGEPEFWRWHKRMRSGLGLFEEEPVRRKNSRRLKTAFRPTSLEAYWLEAGALGHHPAVTAFHQGRQADGSPRNPKYKLHLARAGELKIAAAALPGGS